MTDTRTSKLVNALGPGTIDMKKVIFCQLLILGFDQIFCLTLPLDPQRTQTDTLQYRGKPQYCFGGSKEDWCQLG